MRNDANYLNEMLLTTYSGKKNKSTRFLTNNAMSRTYVYNLLFDIYTKRFKWTYEPEDGIKTINTDLIERTLLTDGHICLFKKDEIWLNCKATFTNEKNFYGDNISAHLFDYNGRSQGIHNILLESDYNNEFSDCAIIYENYQRRSPLYLIHYYADRLQNINVQINAAIKNIRGSNIIYCSSEQAEVVKQNMMLSDLGFPYLVIEEKEKNKVHARMEPKALHTTENTEALDTLFESWDKTMSQFLTDIGIRSNNKMNKLSGVSDMELEEGHQNVDLIINSALDVRKKGIELAEKLGIKGLNY